jgi:hypothetical protein
VYVAPTKSFTFKDRDLAGWERAAEPNAEGRGTALLPKRERSRHLSGVGARDHKGDVQITELAEPDGLAQSVEATAQVLSRGYGATLTSRRGHRSYADWLVLVQADSDLIARLLFSEARRPPVRRGLSFSIASATGAFSRSPER